MSVETLVRDVGELVSLPEVAVRINQMVDDPNVSANDIGKLIGQDPALTIRILRIANSPFYGFSSKIDTVSRAVAMLGSKQIRDLVLATSVAKAFDGLPNELVSMEHFWYHSLYCALLAQHLAAECDKPVQADVVFVAGLLHDIGDLVLFSKVPEQSYEALMYAVEGPEGVEIFDAEREIIGFDHAQVGAALARQWQLPEVLQECIAFHHEPAGARNFPVENAIVHIANSIAYLAEIDSSNLDDAPRIEALAWELTGLNTNVIPGVIEAAKSEIAEMQQVFFTERAG